MGFDQQSRRKTYELTFRPFPGLTVSCRKPGFDALEMLTGAVLALGDDFAGTGLAGEDRLTWWGRLFEAFARSLIGWDLTDGGHAVPATVDGVLSQDHEFLLAVARSWYYVVVLHQEVAEPKTSRFGGSATKRTEGTSEDDEASSDVDALLASLPIITAKPDEALV